MTDFPTVGLKIDLSGVDQGTQAYDKLKQTIVGVGDAFEVAQDKADKASKKTKSSNETAAKSATDAAQKKNTADRSEEQSEKRKAAELERQRKYLLGVRIRSIQMEEATRRAAQIEEVRQAATAAREQERAVRQADAMVRRSAAEQTRIARDLQKTRERAERDAAVAAERARRDEAKAAAQSARDQKAIDDGILAFRIRMRRQEAKEDNDSVRDIMAFRQRMWAQQRKEIADNEAFTTRTVKAAAAAQIRADREAASEAARLQKEQTRAAAAAEKDQVRQARAAAAEMARAWNSAAGGGGGGRGLLGGLFGGGGGGSNPFGAITGALGILRRSLMEVRRLFFDLRTAVALFLGGLVIRPLIEMADAMTSLKARAGAFADQASDVPYLMEALFQSAQRARQPLDALAILYTRLAPLAKELGKSQKELVQITETVAKGLTIGGATAEEARASSQQLAQALASNRLGGDELRSLAENAPILMAKISKSLGMNTGQFIKWAHEGKANAKVVVDAIQKASTDIDALFAHMPITIGQSITLVKNAFENLVGRVNDATKVSQSIALLIAQFASFLEADRTVRALVSGIEAMTVAMKVLGGALKTILDYLPAIAAGLTAIGVAVLASRAWAAAVQLVAAEMLVFNAAVAASGVPLAAMTAETAVARVVLLGLGAAARTVGAILAAIFTPLNLLVGVVIALAVAINMAKNAAKAAERAFLDYSDAAGRGGTAIERAMDLTEAYGGSSDKLNTILGKVIDSTEHRTDAEAQLQNQAQNRLDLEKMMAEAALATAAADATAAASAQRRQAAIAGFFAGTNEFSGKYLPQPKSQRDKDLANAADGRRQQAILLDAAGLNDKLATNLLAAKDNLHGQKLTATVPDQAGHANMPAAVVKGLEGAEDKIAKLQAKLDGLRQTFRTMSAEDPFSAWAAEIAQAGDEAAAALEAGQKQNAGLAAQTRSLAEQVKQYELLNKVQQESVNNTRDATHAAKDIADKDAAQLRAQNLMHDFMGRAIVDEDGYMKALKASRDAITDQEVAEAKLAVARRYGVDSLGEIAAKVTAAQSATGTAADEAAANGKRAELQAIAEAAAQEKVIRATRTGNDELSKREDVLAGIDIQYQRIFEHMDRMEERTRALGDSMAAAFGAPGQALSDLLTIMDDYIRKEAEVQKLRAIADKDPTADNVQRAADATEQLGEARTKAYGDMIDAAKGFFDENSKGYALLTALEKGYRLFEFAMSAKSIVVKTIETAAKIGLFGAQAQAAATAGAANMFATLGPAGFVAVAAMVAVLAGLGLSLGGALGGGGYSGPTSDDRQAAQGAGTVLGDAAAKSDSITNSLDIMASNSNKQLEYTNDMLQSLRSIDGQITALAGAIGRELGSGGALSTAGLGLGTTNSRGKFSPLGLLLGGLAGGFGPMLATKTTTNSLNDQGIHFNSGALADVISNGLGGNFYQEVISETKKKFLGITYSDKTNLNTTTSPIGDDLSRQIGLVLKSLSDGVVEAAKMLGRDGGAEMLKNFMVSLGDVSFKDMDAAAITKTIENMLSKAGDQMASFIVPELEQFQKAGEGAFETLVRLARDMQVLDVSLASIGRTFGAVGISSLKARENLIDMAGGISELVDQISTFADRFLTDAEKLAPVQASVTAEMARLGLAGITTKDAFKQVVLGLDLTTDRGQEVFAALMKVAPAFADVADAADAARQALIDAAKAEKDAADARLDAAKTATNDAMNALLDAYNAQIGPAQAALADAQQKAADARQALVDSYTAEAGALVSTVQKLRDFANSLRTLRTNLITGDFSTANPVVRRTAAKSAFDQALQGDDSGAVQSAAQAFLQASQDAASTQQQYQQDFAYVISSLNNSISGADQQADIAQKQLDALNTLVDGIDGIVDGVFHLGDDVLVLKDGIFQTAANVLTVADAINNLQLAEAAVTVAESVVVQINNSFDGLDGVIDGIVHLGDITLTMKDGVFQVAQNVLTIPAALAALQAALAEQAAAQLAADQANANLIVVTAQAAAAAAAQAAAAAAAAAAALAQINSTAVTPPTTVTPPTPANSNVWTAEGYLAKNPDVLAEAQKLLASADRNSPWFTEHYLDRGVSGFAQWHWEHYGQAEHRAFANGGAFANSIVRAPTFFDMGQMGEAGAEGILPLANIDGTLGVHAAGINDNSDVVDAINSLGNQVVVLQAAVVAVAKNTSSQERIARKWDTDGIPATRT